MKLVKENNDKILEANKVSDKEAEEAFVKILTWMGEDPNRDCLLYTSDAADGHNVVFWVGGG